MLGLEPAGSALGLVELLQQLLRRVQALSRPLDLPLKYRVPQPDTVDRRPVRVVTGTRSVPCVRSFGVMPVGRSRRPSLAILALLIYRPFD
jgi:hypothetical protein